MSALKHPHPADLDPSFERPTTPAPPSYPRMVRAEPEEPPAAQAEADLPARGAVPEAPETARPPSRTQARVAAPKKPHPGLAVREVNATRNRRRDPRAE